MQGWLWWALTRVPRLRGAPPRRLEDRAPRGGARPSPAAGGTLECAPLVRELDLGEPPPEVTIYAATLLADFPDEEALRREVRRTLIHEIGHYLGLSEEDLHARGLE